MSSKLYKTQQWQRLRAAVLERDGWRCRIRGAGCTGRASHADHIVSPKRGGQFFDAANLRAACEHCNTSRGGREGARIVNRRRSGYPPELRW